VQEVNTLSPRIVADQLEAVLQDIPPAAAKTGALGSSDIVRILSKKADNFDFPLVVDPVMISKHRQALMTKRARVLMAEILLPCAFLVTPNLHEAAELAQMQVDNLAAMKDSAVKIAALGPEAVLVKGGHLKGEAVDVLYFRDEFFYYRTPRIDTIHTHGTGCTYSACITAELAKGRELVDAVSTAKKFITRAITTNPRLGKGAGPVNHHVHLDE
jgi:hydroxymethylpyrimidine/phosphomethylpyrimidine kinase